jgi:hypothetical protein
LAVKQAHKLGYKFKWYSPGTGADVHDFIDWAGYEAAQGIAWAWTAPWAIKKGDVVPDVLEMALRIANRYAQQYGRPMTYLGGFDYGINHLRMLIDFYQQAGTLDPDKVMEVVRGGTVREFTGTWTMGGEKTFGAPVVKPSACIVGYIKGRRMVYGAENPMPSIP